MRESSALASLRNRCLQVLLGHRLQNGYIEHRLGLPDFEKQNKKRGTLFEFQINDD